MGVRDDGDSRGVGAGVYQALGRLNGLSHLTEKMAGCQGKSHVTEMGGVVGDSYTIVTNLQKSGSNQ